VTIDSVPHKTVFDAIGDEVRVVSSGSSFLLDVFQAFYPNILHLLVIDIRRGIYRFQWVSSSVTGTWAVIRQRIGVVDVGTEGELVQNFVAHRCGKTVSIKIRVGNHSFVQHIGVGNPKVALVIASIDRQVVGGRDRKSTRLKSSH